MQDAHRKARAVGLDQVDVEAARRALAPGRGRFGAISAALSADMISSSLSARPATSERSRPSH